MHCRNNKWRENKKKIVNKNWYDTIKARMMSDALDLQYEFDKTVRCMGDTSVVVYSIKNLTMHGCIADAAKRNCDAL